SFGREVMMPATPALSRRWLSEPPPSDTEYPVPRVPPRPPVNPAESSRCTLSLRAIDCGYEFASQSLFGRHDSFGDETITSFPFACGSHFTNSLLSANCGSTTGSASTFLPFVPGL